MGGGCLLFGGELGHVRRRRRVRRSFWLPVLIRLCSSVIHGHLALQRDDGVGALRRRGDRPRAEFRVVDVGRRPPRPKNHNTIKADAVYSSSDWTEAGLDGTGDDGTGPIWPRGVFA